MSDDTEYTVETVHQVRVDRHDARLDIGPDRDGLGCVEIYTSDPKSIEWFGKVGLVLAPKLARLVGKALIAAADEMEKSDG